MDHMREEMTSRPETILNQQTEEENWKELIDTQERSSLSWSSWTPLLHWLKQAVAQVNKSKAVSEGSGWVQERVLSIQFFSMAS